MAGFVVTSVNHTSFTVASVDAGVRFFRDCLGAELVSVAEAANPTGIPRLTGVAGARVKFAFLRWGSQSIELVEYLAPEDRARVQPRPCDRGFAHLALNVDGLQAAVRASAEHGWAPVGEVIQILGGPDKGKSAVYISGSDAITLELVGY